MKFLICGLGSIGQRHIRIIRDVLGDEAEIAAYRSRRLDIVISDKLEASFNNSPEEHYKVHCFYDLDEALAWRPDAVFVTNPISMHMSTAIAAAKAGSNIFIEKPLSNDIDDVEILQELVSENNLICMIGYQLRYHPAYIHIKQLLNEKHLGRLTSADLHFGEWLPGMHPYEDYRSSHAARKEQGGGVILCLSHEIDIAYWLFGSPQKVYCEGGHLSDLDVDVEDTVDMILSCNSAGRQFPIHVHLDFIQKPPRRYIHIVGENGSIIFDYYTNILTLNTLSDDSSEDIAYESFQRNDMFVQEITDFIDSIKKNTKSPIPLEQGLSVMKVSLAAKRSLENGKAELIK